MRIFHIMQPRKLSGHSVFSGERLREAGGPGLNIQLIKEIPSMWKALSDEEKKVCVHCTCTYNVLEKCILFT